MDAQKGQLTKEEIRALQEQNKGLSQEEKQALRKQKKLEKQMAKQKMLEKKTDSEEQGEKPQTSSPANTPSTPPTDSKPPMTKEQIRALQEQNKGLSQEEKQALRKQKKLEKQMAKQNNAKAPTTPKPNPVSPSQTTPKAKSPATPSPPPAVSVPSIDPPKTNFFGYKSNPTSLTSSQLLAMFGKDKPIHPTVLKYALFLTNRLITGSNTHAQVLLNVLSTVVLEFHSPTNYLSELLNYLQIQWQFIQSCKNPTAAMTSVYMHIRECLSKYNHYVTEEETHKLFQEDMATYRDQFTYNFRDISKMISSKIRDHDCILTYGMSDRILEAFKDAKYENKKNFRVIIIDSRPRNASEEMAKKCLENNIRTTFIPLNALPYIMNEVTKCIVSTSSMYSDGSALTIAGGSLIALTCNQHNIPFLVACETYKFANEIFLDSTSMNEIFDPHTARPPNNDKWILEHFDDPSKPLSKFLDILVLSYDLVPASFITGVFTDNPKNGLIPPSSIAFLCRQP